MGGESVTTDSFFHTDNNVIVLDDMMDITSVRFIHWHCRYCGILFDDWDNLQKHLMYGCVYDKMGNKEVDHKQHRIKNRN